MYSWSISWISWCLDGASEVCRWNLSFSLRAVLPVSKQQGAVLNEVSISLVTFCPLRMMGLLQSCLKEEGERKRIERGSARQRHGGRVRGGYCIAQQNSVWGGGVLRFSPCFTSQLCLDKHHSTCVITTDTATFSGHKFRPRLGD